MERRDMRFFRGAARRLLLVAVLGCAVPAAAAQERDPGDRGETAPERSLAPTREPPPPRCAALRDAGGACLVLRNPVG